MSTSPLAVLPCGCPPGRIITAWIGTPAPGWSPGQPAPHVCPLSGAGPTLVALLATIEATADDRARGEHVDAAMDLYLVATIAERSGMKRNVTRVLAAYAEGQSDARDRICGFEPGARSRLGNEPAEMPAMRDFLLASVRRSRVAEVLAAIERWEEETADRAEWIREQSEGRGDGASLLDIAGGTAR